MTKGQWFRMLLILLIVWTVSSLWIDNSIILPRPDEVFLTMYHQALSSTLYYSLMLTIFRVFFSLSLSFGLALFFAFLFFRYNKAAVYFHQILLFLRSIPNVTFIILLLFWVNRELSVTIVAFLLLFPIFYQNIYEALCEIQKTWKDVLKIYPQGFKTRCRILYFPLLKNAVVTSWITCSSLAFKVVVMAEILASVSAGVGSNMQFARLNVDLVGVFAWTIWLLICVSLFNKLLKNILFRIYE